MPTDLNLVSDHPVALLRKAAQDNHDRTHAPLVSAAYEAAAETLRKHQREQGVTFAALDNDALARVAETYAAYTDGSVEGGGELAAAVADLLGLSD